MEEATASNRRVLGEAHPQTQACVDSVTELRNALKAQETPGGIRAFGLRIGLVGKPELNGTEVLVVGFDSAKGLYHVLPESLAERRRTAKPMYINLANITLKPGTAVIIELIEGMDTPVRCNGQRGLVLGQQYGAEYTLCIKGQAEPLNVGLACCRLESIVQHEQQESKGGGPKRRPRSPHPLDVDRPTSPVKIPVDTAAARPHVDANAPAAVAARDVPALRRPGLYLGAVAPTPAPSANSGGGAARRHCWICLGTDVDDEGGSAGET
jgi:hypothetical protein